jgi:glutamine amidotransferase-like uncharacterized protein
MICIGDFLAQPGQFRGRVDEYYSSAGASVITADPAVIPVIWRGARRPMYFQDGGYMVPRRKSTGITVQGRYTNGAIAALVAPYGRGKVGLCGPHPEAPPEWYREANLSYDLCRWHRVPTALQFSDVRRSQLRALVREPLTQRVAGHLW